MFGEGILIDDARYRTTSHDAGIKYRGVSLEEEYYFRIVDNFRGRGTETLPFEELDDTGFQLQGSAMLLPKTVQLYLGGSKVFGEYGGGVAIAREGDHAEGRPALVELRESPLPGWRAGGR